LNSVCSRIICTKFGLIWPAGSGEEDFFKKISVFLFFRYYLPLEKGNTLHLHKTEIPSPKDDLFQVSLNLAQWFCRRRFFLIIPPIFRFLQLYPLLREPDHLFEQTGIPFTKG
jgi:hypothetical protein